MRFKRPIIGLLWLFLLLMVVYVSTSLLGKPFISRYQSLINMAIFLLVALATVKGILPGTKPGTLAAERTTVIGFKDTFVLLIYSVIIQAGVSMGVGALCEAAGRPELAELPLILCLDSIVASICFALFAIWISRAMPVRLLRFEKTNWLVVPVILMAIAGAEILGSEIDNIQRAMFTYPDFFVEMLKDVLGQGIVSLIAVAIVAPFTEEVVFRGIVLGSFIRKYSPRKAIILSAVSFAIVHLNPVQMPTAFGLGILLAWIYYRSGNLWLGIAIHAAHNLFVYIMGNYPLPFQISGFNMPGKFQPVWFDLSGAVLLAAAVAMLSFLYRPRSISDESRVSEVAS